MTISLIVAMSENRVIGRGGKLPWHLPADLKHFKALTTSHTIIMGRKTFESIGRPLPNRRSIVVTRDRNFRAEGVTVAHSLDDALERAADEAEVFVIGGADIFRQALPRAERMHVTLVHAQVQGDVSFPEFDRNEWKLVENERHEADEANALPLSFQRFERRRS